MDDYSERGSDYGSGPGSIYSNSSEDRYLILQEIFGRTINSTSEYYMFPADVSEHRRLDIQHEILKEKLGGLYPRQIAHAVRRLMSRRRSEGGSPPRVLDVGTGSGSWAIDMARLFPRAEVTGMDLVPANSIYEVPPNCCFECDDANLGFRHYTSCFDIVHARGVSSGISSYLDLIKEIWNILRPGGLFLAIEGNLGLYNKEFEPITTTDENHPDFSWMQVMMLSAREAQIARGTDLGVGVKTRGWLDDMGEMWDKKGNFVFYIAVGPWEDPSTPKERFIGELMRQNSLRFLGAVKPLILSHGVLPEVVDHWHAMAEDELKNGRTKTYTRWTCAWAFKASPEPSEAPPETSNASPDASVDE